MKVGKGEINEINGELILTMGGKNYLPTDEIQPGSTAAQLVAMCINRGLVKRSETLNRFCESVRVL